LNLYAFVDNDSLNGIDAFGLMARRPHGVGQVISSILALARVNLPSEFRDTVDVVEDIINTVTPPTDQCNSPGDEVTGSPFTRTFSWTLRISVRVYRNQMLIASGNGTGPIEVDANFSITWLCCCETSGGFSAAPLSITASLENARWTDPEYQVRIFGTGVFERTGSTVDLPGLYSVDVPVPTSLQQCPSENQNL